MLYHDRIAVRKGIDLAKTNNSKECMICHYWSCNRGFEFQDYICNGYHDLTIFCLNISDIAINNVKNVDYRFIIHDINKSEAINLLEESVFEDRGYIKKYCQTFGLT